VKKIISCVLLLSFLSPSLWAEQSGLLSSAQRIAQIAEELKAIQQEKDNILKELQTMNEESKQDLKKREQDLKEREQELQELKNNLELFGNLIDDQAIYLKSLQSKLVFYKTTSIILGVSTLTLLGVLIIVK